MLRPSLRPLGLLSAVLAVTPLTAQTYDPPKGVVAVDGQPAASEQAAPGEITEQRVREVLGYLCSDEMAGRDTPSPAQDTAALWLASNFAKAGLRPLGGPGGDWFHHYTMPGVLVKGDAATLTVGGDMALIPGRDFRVWSAGRAFQADDVVVVPAAEEPPPGDDRAQRRAMAARSARVFTVPEASVLWQAAAGDAVRFAGRRGGGAPVVLLREESVAPLQLPAGTTASLAVPEPVAVEAPLRNVVAFLPGSDLADEYVLVTAHYDHVGVRPGDSGDVIYNGADDNATGTTAVLTLAEHFVAQPLPTRRSLLFVCFSAEEKGLRGSRAFVEAAPVPMESIATVINLEMLGRPEAGKSAYAWVTGAERSDFAAIAGSALARADVELTEFPMARQLFFASDNAAFAQAGVVAHSISAGTLHEDYHQPGDEFEKIDTAHMTQVIRGLAEVVTEFANRDERPEWTEDGKPGERRGR